MNEDQIIQLLSVVNEKLKTDKILSDTARLYFNSLLMDSISEVTLTGIYELHNKLYAK
jgi:hypothetical protein